MSQVDARKDTGMKVQDIAENTFENTEFIPHHECFDKTHVSER